MIWRWRCFLISVWRSSAAWMVASHRVASACVSHIRRCVHSHLHAVRAHTHQPGSTLRRTPGACCRDLLIETASKLKTGGAGPSSSSNSSRSSRSSSAAIWHTCADLGCGTGLMGPLLRPACGWLAGVDLSVGMCNKARERGCYDLVEVGELVEWLQQQRQQQQLGGSQRPFDLLVAADVLVYIGDLQPLLQASAAASEAGWVLQAGRGGAAAACRGRCGIGLCISGVHKGTAARCIDVA